MNHIVRMCSASIDHVEKKLRKQKEDRTLRRLTKKADRFRSPEEARAFREIAQDLEQFFGEGATFTQTVLDREAETFKAEQELRALCGLDTIRKEEEPRGYQELQQTSAGSKIQETALDREVETLKAKQDLRALYGLDTMCKEKEPCAFQELQQAISNFKIQESARPIQRIQSRKPKPPRSYYWPQEAPSAWDHSPLIPFPEEPSSGFVEPQFIIPSITLTPPDPESPSSTYTRPKTIDRSLLSPADARRTPSTNQRKPSNSQARKLRDKARGHRHLAPKPSIFSYNVCSHPKCPLTYYAHEKGVFLYPGKYATDAEYKSAQSTFENGNPPPYVWDAYLEAMEDLNASGGNIEAVSKEDVEIVGGFIAAHPRP